MSSPTIVTKRLPAPDPWQPMQWRSSDDGITWSGWRPLLYLGEKLPPAKFAQARILVYGVWRTSPVGLWE